MARQNEIVLLRRFCVFCCPVYISSPVKLKVPVLVILILSEREDILCANAAKILHI